MFISLREAVNGDGLTKEANISARNTRNSPKLRSWNALSFCHTVAAPGADSVASASAGPA